MHRGASRSSCITTPDTLPNAGSSSATPDDHHARSHSRWHDGHTASQSRRRYSLAPTAATEPIVTITVTSILVMMPPCKATSVLILTCTNKHVVMMHGTTISTTMLSCTKKQQRPLVTMHGAAISPRCPRSSSIRLSRFTVQQSRPRRSLE